MIYPYAPWSALLIKNKTKTIVIGDLHIGYEFELIKMGINLPSQTGKLKENLIRLLDESKPDRLIFLGDFKHAIPKISIPEWLDIPLFLNEIKKKVSSVYIIPGNHDGRLSVFSVEDVKIASRRGLFLEEDGGIGLFHGHTWPSPKLFEANFWVTAHNHPTIQIRGLYGFRVIKPVWVKVPTMRRKMVELFLKHRNVKFKGSSPEEALKKTYGVEANCSKLIIMPAFNELLGGLTFNTKNQKDFSGPILRFKAVDLDRADVFLTDGTYLGILKDLKRFG